MKFLTNERREDTAKKINFIGDFSFSQNTNGGGDDEGGGGGKCAQ